MPYSRRSGKRYAAGSQVTWADHDSRVCCVCDRRITLTQAFVCSSLPVPLSAHVSCGGMGAIGHARTGGRP